MSGGWTCKSCMTRPRRCATPRTAWRLYPKTSASNLVFVQLLVEFQAYVCPCYMLSIMHC